MYFFSNSPCTGQVRVYHVSRCRALAQARQLTVKCYEQDEKISQLSNVFFSSAEHEEVRMIENGELTLLTKVVLPVPPSPTIAV